MDIVHTSQQQYQEMGLIYHSQQLLFLCVSIAYGLCLVPFGPTCTFIACLVAATNTGPLLAQRDLRVSH
ncbi:hypothetical protein PAXRUDRAFT_823704 [Paxillus rubicundulus Ve08.2h10]|uniref:Uncharacterized protein n=1 Tax=Paxillus rubicundulus Ve08.2h10 TaxID=930991 RepID=A0A0D0E375_9AGAM|nr:hypothetical protein PAXRUDRAFT_823704 [Paxillus rubicundulus Ve08.2h10]